ncbi:TetR family transcriptional regulator [Neisseria chenwenguii]|uniref:TetR family transcriptional regulator n=1 Tax=Neisseria chenwenguii TaxID=1853278 RepID=A0A220S4N6_9NEIS|nr:TetR/AcrR family transcriptional regulator [Neisseria chenwenguii]ASK28481.1 TetR family transcriptional regulator [Neisseria chenwenguii]
MRQENTREKLLDLADRLIREKGYSSFSYADLAKEIGISKASIHHHFPAKEDLGLAVVEQTQTALAERLAAIRQQFSSAKERLQAYIDIFAEGLHTPLLPLCGAMSAEMANLPEALQMKTCDYFSFQLKWLESVLQEAAANGECSGVLPADAALLVLNACEGASLVAKAVERTDIFELTKQQIWTALQAA